MDNMIPIETLIITVICILLYGLLGIGFKNMEATARMFDRISTPLYVLMWPLLLCFAAFED